jgi:hypothetical protein
MARSRILILAVLVLAGCRSGVVQSPEMFPKTAGAWHRTSLQISKEAAMPGTERVLMAAYEGPGKVEARVYQLRSAALAADVMRRWTPTADTVAFESDRFFVVVRWQAAERAALQEFVRGLQQRMRVR